jgi:uncharacterized protein GlcG (DUF336 family)
MQSKETLRLEEANSAVGAILDEASKEPERPVTAAVVDDRGALIAFARMDGARVLTTRLAFTKAYTAALLRRNTADVQEMLKNQGWTVADLGDANFTSIRGGVAVIRDGTNDALGGIGVSGRSAEEDEELATIGVGAIGL